MPPLIRTDPTAYGLHPAAVEILERRHPAAKHFRLPSGQFAGVFAGPMHYATPDGLDDIVLAARLVGADQVFDRTRYPVRVTDAGIEITHPITGQGVRWRSAARPVVVDHHVTFTVGPLLLDYAVLPWGLKLTAAVPAPLGQRQLDIPYTPLGGSALRERADGGLDGDGFVIARPHADGADGLMYFPAQWTVRPNGAVRLVWDDRAIPATAYPLLFDPSTTFDIAASQDDARVTGLSGAYPPAYSSASHTETISTTKKQFTSGTGNYQTVNCLFSWDTSSLDDTTTVTATDLQFYVTGHQDLNTRNFVAEWYDWGGTEDSADYTSTDANTAHSGTSLGSIVDNQYNVFSLQNLSNVSLVSTTRIRTHITGGAPTTNATGNFVNARMQDGGLSNPQLVVTYTAAGNPAFGMETMAQAQTALLRY